MVILSIGVSLCGLSMGLFSVFSFYGSSNGLFSDGLTL